MKKIHIRFVKKVIRERDGNKRTYYYMQRKTIFGNWKDIGYWQGSMDANVFNIYTSETKEKLLDLVLEDYFEVPKTRVIIYQHPTLKIY